MANPVWDGIVTYVTWTASTTSTSFNIPRDAGAITFILPDFTTDTSCAVHGLDPVDKTTWRAVNSYDPGDASHTPLVLNENLYVVVPASALGTGTFRLVNVNAQTGTATIIIDRI
jgi:hypothetical protein